MIDGTRTTPGGPRLGGGRAWGLGLLALGGVLGVLLFLWLVVQAASGQLNAGGIVLWLVLLAVLALPPLGAGYYLWRRGAAEEQEAARFEARRSVLEGDALFRQQAADDLRRLAERIADAAPQQAAAAKRLRDLAGSVDGVRRDEAAWYESSPLSDADLPLVRRYEDALQAESDALATLATRLERGDAASVPALGEAVDRWERVFRRREALLLRGRRGASVAAEELLKARAPSRGATALAALRLGDAVTVDFEDYLVQGVVSYFAEGRTWHVWILRDGDAERWLWGAPGNLAWAVLDPPPAPPAAGSPTFTLDGTELTLVESGRATADVESAAGGESGVAVEYWRYGGPNRQMALVERWPNSVRAAAGHETLADTIDVWPQSATSST